jgi:hypothetical protein
VERAGSRLRKKWENLGMFSGLRVLKSDQQPSQLIRKQRGGRILLLLIIGGAVIGLVTTLGVVFLLMGSRPLPPEEQLEVSCRMIEEGRWDIPMAVGESLSLGSEEQALDFQSRLAFVQGSARVLQINENREYPDAQALLTKASEKLAFSDKVGFPLGYRETGSYLLAWAYFHSRQWNAGNARFGKGSRVMSGTSSRNYGDDDSSSFE